MTKQELTLQLIASWWEALTPVRQNNNLPAKGTVSGALVVVERLQNEYILDINHHRTRGQAQIAGAGKAATRKILAKFGENRPFSEEGGRTNRGLAGDIANLLDFLKKAELDELTVGERNLVLTEVQRFLVAKVGEYFSRERIKFPYDPEKTAWQSVHEILEQARQVGKEGPVAQYLVGAKLSLRFPEITIRNDSYSTSDFQSGIPGDFLVNDTAFHVTVAPTQSHYQKCIANVSSGYRVYLLVPNRILLGAQQNAELVLPNRITVRCVETFVSQNIEELAVFTKGGLISGFRRLLKTYNQRVEAVESDKSMLIEMPRTLQ